MRGRRPYGKNNREREVIRLMKRYHNIHHGKRRTVYEIAELLNEKGIKPPAGEMWYGSSVKNILQRCEDRQIRQRQIKRRNHLDIPQAVSLWSAVCAVAENGTRRDRRRKMIVALFLFSGLRCFELTDLQFRDLPVKHGKGMIVVREGKRRKYGEIHISEFLRGLLDNYVARVFSSVPRSKLPETDFLLRNEYGRKYSTASIWGIVKRVGRKHNLEFLHPHALRHTYASILLFDTKDQHFVRRQLRHRSSATTDIYVGNIVMKIDEQTPEPVIKLLTAINPLHDLTINIIGVLLIVIFKVSFCMGLQA